MISYLPLRLPAGYISEPIGLQYNFVLVKNCLVNVTSIRTGTVLYILFMLVFFSEFSYLFFFQSTVT